MNRQCITTAVWIFIGTLCITPVSLAKEYISHVQADIVFDKETYKLGEKIEGQVHVYSTAPATVTMSFQLRMYLNGELEHQTITEIKNVFTGENEYPLEVFGIPETFAKRSSVGQWRMTIGELGLDNNVLAEIFFKIVK